MMTLLKNDTIISLYRGGYLIYAKIVGNDEDTYDTNYYIQYLVNSKCDDVTWYDEMILYSDIMEVIQ